MCENLVSRKVCENKCCFVLQYSDAVWFHSWLQIRLELHRDVAIRCMVLPCRPSLWRARMRLEYNYINWPRIQKQLDEVIFAHLSKIVFSKLAASKRLRSKHSRYFKNGCSAQKTVHLEVKWMSAESRESQAVKDSKAAICVAAQLLLCQLSEKVKPGDPCCSGEMTVLIFQLGKPSYWSTITRSSKLAYAGFCFHNGDLVPGAECILLFPDWGLHYSYRNQQVRLFRFQHFDSLTVSTSALVSWMSLSCEGNGLWLWRMVGEGKRKGLGRQDLDDSVLSLTKALFRVTIGMPCYFGYPTSRSCSVAHSFVPMAALLDLSLIRPRPRHGTRGTETETEIETEIGTETADAITRQHLSMSETRARLYKSYIP